MGRCFCSLKICLFFLFISFILYAQTEDTTVISTSTESECWHGSFGIPTNSAGIGFGNSKNFAGLRFNFSDCGVERIDGINVTLIWPQSNPYSEIKGIALGVVGPGGRKISGIAFGGIEIQATESLTGLSFSTFISSSGGEMTGVQAGGLALLAKGNIVGVNLAGFGIDCYGDISGISFGGIVLASSLGMTGINLSGFATVSEWDVTGLNMAGFVLHSSNTLSGLNIAPAISSYNTIGISAGLYHKAENSMTGISFALINYAAELFGIQIGLINIAENNPLPFRILPLINIH